MHGGFDLYHSTHQNFFPGHHHEEFIISNKLLLKQHPNLQSDRQIKITILMHSTHLKKKKVKLSQPLL